MGLTMERIRRIADQCSGLQGFAVFLATGGGTGSGLGSLLLERLSVDYSKKSKLCYTVYPSPKISTAVVEPYNSVLTTHSLLDYASVVSCLDNEAVYEICKNGLDLARPTYRNLDPVLRAAERGHQRVPDQPRPVPPDPLHAQLLRAHRLQGEGPPGAPERAGDHAGGVRAAEPDGQVRPAQRQVHVVLPAYRGDVVPKDVNQAIQTVKAKQTVQFVDWSPTGFKCGISSQPMCAVPGGDFAQAERSVCMVSNSTAIAEVFQRIDHKFD